MSLRSESGSRGGRRRRGRGRLRLLLVLLVLLLVFLAWGAFSLWRLGGSVSGSSAVEDSIDSGPEPAVRLANDRGDVVVDGVADLRSVEFEATRYALGPDRAAAREAAAEVPVDVSRDGSAFAIETDSDRNTGADYALRVPKNATLEIEVGAGDVRVTGLESEVSVRSVSGDVTVTGARDSVTVEVPAGDVTLSDVRTDTGKVEIIVGTGDLILNNLVVGTVEARVETGDVTLSGRFSGDGRISTRTGSITSRLPREDARELTLQTRVGEVIRREPAGGGAG